MGTEQAAKVAKILADRALNARAFQAGAAGTITKGSGAANLLNMVRLALAAGRTREAGGEG